MEDSMWDIKEASEYLGCAIQTLRAWTSSNRIPYYKVGHFIRFRKSDLDKWLDECSVPIKK